MPVNWAKYPKNWKEIRAHILERAGNKCERCGAVNYEPHPITGSKVVLTIAHLDNDTTHNTDDNLEAMCQKCHLAYDRDLHTINAAKTRERKLKEKYANKKIDL